MLEPLLVNIFINALEEETKCTFNEFAGDTELGQGGSQGVEFPFRKTRKAGGMDQQGSQEIQQRQVQGPVPRID